MMQIQIELNAFVMFLMFVMLILYKPNKNLTEFVSFWIMMFSIVWIRFWWWRELLLYLMKEKSLEMVSRIF